ncbi:radial spoke head 1 homolog [Uranotaenia lowii]|uniref:radial spoke head 1 homolog n=1 Tax=Uranotaenia lowii TaxID=190385 RepID=UPI002479C0F0|nr:radial spoke head 1 homolog [Uranotaenia lowii]
MIHKLCREKIQSEYSPPEDEVPLLFELQKYNGPRNKQFEPHGEGRIKFEDGYRYQGSFRKGQLHGQGRLFLRDGYRYDGYWRKGMKHGTGQMYYPDCSWYEGEFKKNYRHGSGKYYYPNGAVYEGNWFKDRRHGVGSYHFSKDGITLRGTWVEGTARGPAEILMDGCRFHGYWDENYPIGPGCFSFDAKTILRGKFYTEPMDGDASGDRKLIWQPECFEEYRYSKLPLEALPQPVIDSEVSELSSSDDDDDDGIECSSVDSTHRSTIVLSKKSNKTEESEIVRLSDILPI